MNKSSGFHCPHCGNWISGVMPQRSTEQTLQEASNFFAKRLLVFVCIVIVGILVLVNS